MNKLPWHENRKWGKRHLHQINKIIIHQALCDATVAEINRYHIGPNHISDKGCPHFCYHYGVEKNGTVIQANDLEHITWHTTGANITGLSILVTGNLSAPGHFMNTTEPTARQMNSLEQLCNNLLEVFGFTWLEIYGHYHFGKRSCPGTRIEEWIESGRSKCLLSGKVIKPQTEYLQKLLNFRGYNAGPVDGIFGPKTAAALRKFQKENHLVPDGVPGLETWAALQKFNSKTPSYENKETYTR